MMGRSSANSLQNYPNPVRGTLATTTPLPANTMKVTISNIQRAIEQHYHNTIPGNDPRETMGHQKMVRVIQVLQMLENEPGFTASEILEVAYKAAQLQISDDSRR